MTHNEAVHTLARAGPVLCSRALRRSDRNFSFTWVLQHNNWLDRQHNACWCLGNRFNKDRLYSEVTWSEKTTVATAGNGTIWQPNLWRHHQIFKCYWCREISLKYIHEQNIMQTTTSYYNRVTIACLLCYSTKVLCISRPKLSGVLLQRQKASVTLLFMPLFPYPS